MENDKKQALALTTLILGIATSYRCRDLSHMPLAESTELFQCDVGERQNTEYSQNQNYNTYALRKGR